MSSGFPRQRKYGDHVAVENEGKMARGLPWIVFPTLPARNNEKSKTNKPPNLLIQLDPITTLPGSVLHRGLGCCFYCPAVL